MTSEAANQPFELFGSSCVCFGSGFRRFGHFSCVCVRLISVLCTKTISLQRCDLSDDNFALSSDYDLLYTELTGATVLYLDEYGV